MVNAAIAGLGAGVIAKIGNTFASGVAGYVIGGLSLPKSKTIGGLYKMAGSRCIQCLY